MNWKKPTFWAAVGTAAGVLALQGMSSAQIAAADKYSSIAGIVAACVLAAVGAFRAGLRQSDTLTGQATRDSQTGRAEARGSLNDGGGN